MNYDNSISILTVLFDKSVLKHLKCKVNDYLMIIQSVHNYSHFIIVKSDTGYRIKRNHDFKKCYEIKVNHKFDYINNLQNKISTYFLKSTGLIRIIIDD